MPNTFKPRLAVVSTDTLPSATATPDRAPRYVRWPVYNSDRKIVGFELLKIGPDLTASIRKMAEESSR